MGDENHVGRTMYVSPHYQFMYSRLPEWCYKQVALHVVAFLFSHTC